MHYWLMKTEPTTYAYEDLEKKGEDHWDGVRNHQAQNYMKQMAVGDRVLIYHSMGPKAVVGLAEVTRTAYPDPTVSPDEKWIAVNVKPIRKLPQPVSLATIKATDALAHIPLIKQSRLSVMPLEKTAFDRILALGE